MFKGWLAGLLGFALVPGVVQAEEGRFFVDYSDKPDMEAAASFEWSIINREAEVDLEKVRETGHRVYAYLSVVEVSADASYAGEIDARGIRRVVKNAEWGSSAVDVSSAAWSDLIIKELARKEVEKGFDGFFLDTVDSLDLLVREEPTKAEKYRAALVKLIKNLKAAYPEKKILMNRGFELLPELEGVVDGLVVESVFQTYDFAKKEYVKARASDTEQLLKQIKEVRAGGLPVAVIDYVSPDDKELAARTAKRIEALGCSAFVTTPALGGVNLVPAQ